MGITYVLRDLLPGPGLHVPGLRTAPVIPVILSVLPLDELH